MHLLSLLKMKCNTYEQCSINSRIIAIKCQLSHSWNTELKHDNRNVQGDLGTLGRDTLGSSGLGLSVAHLVYP